MPQCDVKTRYIPATFAWTILLGTTFLFFYYPCQYYIFRQPWVPAYQGAITFFVLANFTLATFMDPGVIPKAPPDEDREDDFRAPLYKNVEINGITVRMKWCVTCKFYRPPRCSHCSVCNHCIETFDHHCPWVNNCIGRRNYRFFFFFLISLSIHMISIFSLCLIYVLHSKDKLGQVEPIVAMVLMGIVTLLAIPIFGLTGFHMVLVSRGRTTNEQVTGKFKGGYNPFSRGCWNNCCYAQFGPQYPSLMKPSKYASKRAQQMAGVATIHQDNAQVKTLTYLDNGHSHPTRTQHPHYNKLSPGRDNSDTDMDPMASVSQDCEATPPLLRHPGHPPPHPLAHMGGMGSQNNFYPHPLHQGDGQSPRQPQRAGQYPAIVRHSPHTRQRVLDGGRSYTPEVTSPSEQMGHREQSVPTTQQRMRALGVATPLALSSPVRRSNPGTPTQPRRPDFIGVSNAPNVPASYYDFQQSAVQPRGPVQGSPQRRFLSEGELVRQNSELSYPRSNTTVDNIRELAGSPQKGVYMWKDTSPSTYQSSNNTQKHGFEYYRSNPTSPIQQPPPQQQQQQQHQQQLPMNQGNNGPMQVAHSRPYHPALRGGVAVFPPSPQVKRKLTPSTATPNVPGRRPISFVRALEMTDNIEMTDAPIPEHRNNRSTTPTPDRASVYDMNYEISV